MAFGRDTEERIPMITLLTSPYPSLVLTLGFTYLLLSDIFDSTLQFCVHRVVYV